MTVTMQSLTPAGSLARGYIRGAVWHYVPAGQQMRRTSWGSLKHTSRCGLSSTDIRFVRATVDDQARLCQKCFLDAAHQDRRARRDDARELVGRVAGYTEHKLSCATLNPEPGPCDCGLATVLTDLVLRLTEQTR